MALAYKSPSCTVAQFLDAYFKCRDLEIFFTPDLIMLFFIPQYHKTDHQTLLNWKNTQLHTGELRLLKAIGCIDKNLGDAPVNTRVLEKRESSLFTPIDHLF